MELLEKHFETAFNSPNGIKELRSLILKLAMMGKLVPQDPSDQPASELLKEIQSEKERLIADGKIKKQKALPAIKPEKIPYSLSTGWEWCYLIDLVDVGTGSTPTKGRIDYYRNGTIPWYTSSATNDYFAKEPETFITDKAIVETNCKVFPSGSLIIALYGQGKTRGQISEIILPGATNQAIAAMIFNTKSEPLKDYIKYYFKKIYDEIREKAEGGAQPNLNVGKIKETYIPLPPLNEQKRIVTKINELIARCDEMERLKREKEEKRLQVNTSALHHLLESPDKESFQNSFNFITRNFSHIYSVKENVEKLKKAILQLAMMGKLVPQDPNDQPASELLKEIQAEKEKLIAEGKIKKQKDLPAIKTEEIPYGVPAGWVWCRLGEITHNWRQKTPDAQFTYIDVGSIDNSKGIINNPQVLEAKVAPSRARKIVRIGTVIYSTVRPYLKNISIIKQDFEPEPIASTAFAILHPYTGMNSLFLCYYLNSSIFDSYVISMMKGVAYPAIAEKEFFNGLIPIPPIKEQKRIVLKIKELTVLCESIVNKIDQSDHSRDRLLRSVLASL